MSQRGTIKNRRTASAYFVSGGATSLGWYAGLIEGVTTIAFSAVGAGGVEGITSGAAREALRESLRGSVRSAWKEGGKAFAKGVLGELGEEELITLLDTAAVQTTLRPGMTAEDIKRAVYETAVVTLIASGGFAAGHGKHAFDDTIENNRMIGQEQFATRTPDMDSDASGTAIPAGTESGNSPENRHVGSKNFLDSEQFPGAEIAGDDILFNFGYPPNPSQPPPSLSAYLDGDGILFYGIQTPKENSPIRGREMFDRMISHFGERINGIQGEWYSDNISKENPRSNLYTANQLTGTGLPLEEAAMLTFTGKMRPNMDSRQRKLLKPRELRASIPPSKLFSENHEIHLRPDQITP